MNCSFSAAVSPVSTPLTTAPRIIGRTFSKDWSTLIVMSPVAMFNSGTESVPYMKGLIAWAKVSADNKSGRSGKISISSIESSHKSMSVPSSGNSSAIRLG